KGATILLVEDDEKIREIAGRRLAKAGFQMIIAADGQEALSQMEAGEKAPDLLFTDMVMPGMGGRELSRQLKERYPGLLVLYSSGYTDDSTIKELGDGEAFLRKPYTIKALLAAISRLLDVD
ncbi:MAG: response regulator, partial [Desulfobacterales bacterium]|nr:response regulator [Desulfobacterales bacterium]